MKLKEVVSIVLETKHGEENPHCPLCDSPVARGHQRFEQWGTNVSIVTDNLATYTCIGECGITWLDRGALLEFKKRQLEILIKKGDIGLLRYVRNEIKSFTSLLQES